MEENEIENQENKKKKGKIVIHPLNICLGIIIGLLLASTATMTALFSSSTTKKNELEISNKSYKNEKIELTNQINSLIQEKENLTLQVQTLTQEKNSLMEEKTLLEAQRSNLQTQVNTLESNITDLNSQIANKNAQINDLNSQITDKNTQITNLNSQITDNNTQIAQLTAEVNTLTQEKTTLETQRSNLQTQVNSLESNIINLNTQITDKDAQISGLNTQITNKNTEITNLNSQITDKNTQITNLTTELNTYKDLANTFSVFYSDNNETKYVEQVKKGENVLSVPDVPTKTGYSSSWSNNGKNITQDTVIYCQYSVIEYNYSFVSEDNFTIVSSSNDKVSYETPVTIVVAPGTTFNLPSSITVDNASYTYDRDTGSIYLYNPTGDISITVTPTQKITYNIDWHKDFGGDDLYLKSLASKHFVTGKTSDYLSEIAGLTPVLVGETENDHVYFYEKPIVGGYDVYILADELIRFEDDDLLPLAISNMEFNTYAEFDAYLDTHTFDAGDVVKILCDEMQYGIPSYYINDTYGFEYIGTDYSLFTNFESESIVLHNIDTKSLTNFCSIFSNCLNLTTLDISQMSTESGKCFLSAFAGSSQLEYIDVSNFDTSNGVTFYGMFSGCTELVFLDVSRFNMEKAQDIVEMFFDCSNLSYLDTSEWYTPELSFMYNAFTSCKKITKIDLGKFDTSGVGSLAGLFEDCSSLKKVNVSSFDTTHVTNLCGLFYDCPSITEVDLSSFDTSNVTNMSNVFTRSENLRTIIVSEKFKTDNVTTSAGMFEGCFSLSGSNGFAYDDTYIDKTMAKVNLMGAGGYPTIKGYFTAAFKCTLGGHAMDTSNSGIKLNNVPVALDSEELCYQLIEVHDGDEIKIFGNGHTYQVYYYTYRFDEKNTYLSGTLSGTTSFTIDGNYRYYIDIDFAGI